MKTTTIIHVHGPQIYFLMRYTDELKCVQLNCIHGMCPTHPLALWSKCII